MAARSHEKQAKKSTSRKRDRGGDGGADVDDVDVEEDARARKRVEVDVEASAGADADAEAEAKSESDLYTWRHDFIAAVTSESELRKADEKVMRDEALCGVTEVLSDSDVSRRTDPVRVKRLRANVRKFLSRTRREGCETAAWLRRLNLRAYFVESGETFKEIIMGPLTSGVFVVDTTNNEYKIGAAVITGLFGSKQIVVLDRTTSLELIFAVVLGAITACGQGCIVHISLDVCDIATQANAARTFPVSQFCTYEAVYPAVLQRLRIKFGFHETEMADCELRYELQAWGVSHEVLRRNDLPPVIEELYSARWYESELGTLAIAKHRRMDAEIDVVVVMFTFWCEDAFHMLRRFLMTQVRENLLLYLQRDGDTGPDVVSRTEMLDRMRKVKPYRPVCESGLTSVDIHEMRHHFPVMAFEGAEVLVHCVDGPAARRLFPRIYKLGDIISMHNDVLFIALSKTYSHIVSYAVCASDAAAMTVVAAKRLIHELWYVMYQFASVPLQVADGIGIEIPSEFAVAHSVVYMTPKGSAFMYELTREQFRPSISKIRNKITAEYSREHPYVLERPHILEQDQGIITDANCWKRLGGYVGMTPNTTGPGLILRATHPNVKYVLYSSGLDTASSITVSVFGDVFMSVPNHLYTIDDPNYVYVKPPFDYHANDAWFDKLTSYFADDVDLIKRIHAKREQVEAASRMAALDNPVSYPPLFELAKFKAGEQKPATATFTFTGSSPESAKDDVVRKAFTFTGSSPESAEDDVTRKPFTFTG